MNSKKRIALFLFTGLLFACSNDNPETLIDSTPILEEITYSKNIKSIIDNNCISCHAQVPINGAPMSLVTYEQVRNAVQNRGLINRISLDNGNSLLMPQGGPKLPQPTIDLVINWEQDGLLE